MTLTIPDDVRAKAEIYVGDAAGQEKTRLLLQETGLPLGLLPLRDIIECGYVESTGFVWLKQRRKVDHYFAKAGRHVSYGAEVSAVAEKGRLRKITGVKAKEMLVWITLHEICLEDVDKPPVAPNKLVCKAIGGLSRTFPVEAFEADGPPPPAPAVAGKLLGGAKNGGEANGVKPAVVAAGGEKVAEAAAKKQQEEADKKKPEKEEAKKDGAAAAEGDDSKAKEEEAGKNKDSVEGVEEKLKELSTEAVQAEAVAAKN